eukprot:TRINITY_DN27461_c0_g1_i1.p1 TRINITY_DN27461_c0_g1~~TRINITY_DN27461_c0_g1_i1.p1  ORF type:complete len:367 (+),score=47.47 TRINITY_DN27461_c0_g1_i1:40-1140(+)
MRILVCQTAALSDDVSENVARWREKLAAYDEADGIDLVQFPEVAFSRYYFSDLADALPSMEAEGKGPVFAFLSELAKRLRAYVVCGYMQKAQLDDDNASAAAGHSAQKGHNSLYLLTRDGDMLRPSYHKRHLFQPDKTWSEPGRQDQPLSFELWSKDQSQKYVAGLINCQEILGDMDDRDAAGGPAARRLRNEPCGTTAGYDGIDIVVYSTCWPLSLPEPPKDFAGVWERAIKTDFLLKEQTGDDYDNLRRKPLVFSTACCVGSERNATTPESWDGRPEKMRQAFASPYLSKRGCSGIKVYSIPVVDKRSCFPDESDVKVEVPSVQPPKPAFRPETDEHGASALWSPGQVCMSSEFEELRVFDVAI